MVRPLNLYETGRGDFAPAWLLTPTEAVALDERGEIDATDTALLSFAALGAVVERRARVESATSAPAPAAQTWGRRAGDPVVIEVEEVQ